MAHQLKDKESYQRLNYLYQAAHCVLSQNPENVELARFYCFTQRTIARRLVLRQPISEETVMQEVLLVAHPRCNCYSKTKKKNSKTRFTVVRCLSCGQTKTLLNNPDHCLWVDRPEAQMEQKKQSDPAASFKKAKKPKGTKPDESVSPKPSAAQSAAGT